VHVAGNLIDACVNVSSKLLDGTPPRSLATQIFYLLTYDDPQGVFHMVSQSYHGNYALLFILEIAEQIGRMSNSLCCVRHLISVQTYHVLHQGRAEYTLITPGNPPVIEKKLMGTNVKAGEQRQLLVGTGVWKMSRIPPEDLAAAKTQDEKDRTGCLITEVVTPGFAWQDHKYLTLEGLQELFKGQKNWDEKVKDIVPFVKV
jgi:uncharacterized protein